MFSRYRAMISDSRLLNVIDGLNNQADLDRQVHNPPFIQMEPIPEERGDEKQPSQETQDLPLNIHRQFTI